MASIQKYLLFMYKMARKSDFRLNNFVVLSLNTLFLLLLFAFKRVITIGETSFVFGVSESSHAYSESDDLLIRNQSDNPNQTGVSVKPDVTCTTSVVESIHSTGAPGCSSSNSDDALVNQPHSLIDNQSNCEPDITLCTVVCNPGNVDDSPEPQPDTRSDGEGEEGDDLDVVLRNPAVGQVDDDL